MVGDRWRKKRLARHLDQGMYFENMGLLKIDDALLEFRRALHLDPTNAVAKEHLKKLERDRDKVAAMQPKEAAAAAPSEAKPNAKAPAAPAPAPKRAATGAAGAKKGGLPLPVLIGIAVALVAVVGVVAVMMSRGSASSNPGAADSGIPPASESNDALASQGAGVPAESLTSSRPAAPLPAPPATPATVGLPGGKPAAPPVPSATAITPPATTEATLLVTANPFANFTVDGEAKNQNAKAWRGVIKPGKHSVRIEHPTLGFKEWEIEVDAGEAKELAYDFLATSSGSISVTSEGGWAEIYLDGDKTGHTTPYVITGVAPGKHEVALVREGYSVAGGANSVNVKVGQQAEVLFKLKQKK